MGTDPKVADTRLPLEVSLSPSALIASYSVNILRPDVDLRLESSTNLINWTTVSNVESVVDNGDATESVTISDDELLVNNERKFIRVRVTEL